jgi:hypothetical protein
MHVAKRKRIYEEQHGKANSARAANKKMGRDVTANLADTFTTHTAKKTGQRGAAKRGLRRASRDVTAGNEL